MANLLVWIDTFYLLWIQTSGDKFYPNFSALSTRLDNYIKCFVWFMHSLIPLFVYPKLQNVQHDALHYCSTMLWLAKKIKNYKYAANPEHAFDSFPAGESIQSWFTFSVEFTLEECDCCAEHVKAHENDTVTKFSTLKGSLVPPLGNPTKESFTMRKDSQWNPFRVLRTLNSYTGI